MLSEGTDLVYIDAGETKVLEILGSISIDTPEMELVDVSAFGAQYTEMKPANFAGSNTLSFTTEFKEETYFFERMRARRQSISVCIAFGDFDQSLRGTPAAIAGILGVAGDPIRTTMPLNECYVTKIKPVIADNAIVSFEISMTFNLEDDAEIYNTPLYVYGLWVGGVADQGLGDENSNLIVWE